jgi:two-component system, NtrC family, sensor kinase
VTNPQTLNRLSFFARFVEKLERVTATAKLRRFALREIARFFKAKHGCIALHDRLADRAVIEPEIHDKAEWDTALFLDFIRNRRPRMPPELLMAPLWVKNRVVGLIAIKGERRFTKGDGRFLCRLADCVSREMTSREELRLLTVRAKVSKDILRGLRPKDVLYKLLDGLQELLRYDHSAAILILNEERNAFLVQAEKITWRKAKSERIGAQLPADAETVRLLLSSHQPLLFHRAENGTWFGTRQPDSLGLMELLDYNHRGDSPAENTVLCAVLHSKDRLLGLLKISSCARQAFDADDVNVVQEFLPQANAAIRLSRLSETLHERTVESEKRAGILEIARGVSHDVNNALGAILPLVQSIISDIHEACGDPAEFLKDMLYIEENVKLCARIFRSMLEYAKTEESPQLLAVDIGRTLRAAVRLLERGLTTQGITVTVEIEDDLPTIEANPNRLQQVFFNLISNARDAMPDGGTLRIRASRDPATVRVSVQDTGAGISKEDLKRVMEPFFTRKKEGTGLGLSICRSILWESNGKLRIESEPGKGTTVFVDFPVSGR